MVKTIKYLAMIFGLSLFIGSAIFGKGIANPKVETTEVFVSPSTAVTNPQGVYPDPYAVKELSNAALLKGALKHYLRAKARIYFLLNVVIFVVALVTTRRNPAAPARVIRVVADIQPRDVLEIRHLDNGLYEIRVTPFREIGVVVLQNVSRRQLIEIAREGEIPVAQEAIAPATDAEREIINRAINNLNQILQRLDDGQIGRLPDRCFLCYELFNQNERTRALGYQCLFGDLANNASHAICEHCYLVDIRRIPGGCCRTCQGRPLPQPL